MWLFRELILDHTLIYWHTHIHWYSLMCGALITILVSQVILCHRSGSDSPPPDMQCSMWYLVVVCDAVTYIPCIIVPYSSFYCVCRSVCLLSTITLIGQSHFKIKIFIITVLDKFHIKIWAIRILFSHPRIPAQTFVMWWCCLSLWYVAIWSVSYRVLV
jgi:hypothetical protein